MSTMPYQPLDADEIKSLALPKLRRGIKYCRKAETGEIFTSDGNPVRRLGEAEILRLPQADPGDEHHAPEPSAEEEDVTSETLTYREYVRLGVVERDAKKERDQIKEREIEPMMDAGVAFGEGEMMLVWEYGTRANFDWQRARKDGKIPDEVWSEYIRIDVTRSLQNRKRDEDGKIREQQKLTMASAAKAMFETLQQLGAEDAWDEYELSDGTPVQQWKNEEIPFQDLIAKAIAAALGGA